MAFVLALTAVRAAVYARFLTDDQLPALAPGGIETDIPPGDHTYPLLWIELLQQRNYGGLGTKPGRGSMPGLTLRLHVFQSDYGTMQDAELAMARAIELLFDETTPLAIDGYTLCSGIPLPEIETIPLPDEVLNGVKVKELVANVDLIVEEVTA